MRRSYKLYADNCLSKLTQFKHLTAQDTRPFLNLSLFDGLRTDPMA